MFVSLDGDYYLLSYNSSFLLIFQLLRSRRPFVAEFTDAMGNEIFTVRFQMIDVFCCNYIEYIIRKKNAAKIYTDAIDIGFRSAGHFGSSTAPFIQKWMARYTLIVLNHSHVSAILI
jgi:hypothetical protein